ISASAWSSLDMCPEPSGLPNDNAQQPGPLECQYSTKVRNAAPVCWSGSGDALLRPRPLRTVRAGFLAYGSSIGQRIRQDTRLPHGRGAHLDVPAAEPAPAMTSVAAVAPAKVVATSPTFLPPSRRRLADGSRPPTPEGSQPAFAGGDTTPIRPMTGRLSLAP